MYVPFWLFDANASGSGQYEATTSSSHRNGDYVITTTRHYDVRRAGTPQFMGVPVDGSTKMPNGHLHPHHRNRNVRPRQGQQQFQRVEYRQRRLRRQLRRKILRVSILTTAAAFFAKAAAGLLSEFFVITMRNVLLFRGAANTKKLLQRLIHAAGVFFTFSFSARTP